jgi:hypothetical protein
MMKKPIGEFHQIAKSFIDNKYRQHEWQVEANGNRWCIKDRDPLRLLHLDRAGIIIERDYTDRVPMAYDKSAMSVGMDGGNSTVGMEGFLNEHRLNNNEEPQTVLDNDSPDATIVDENEQRAVDWDQVLNSIAVPEAPIGALDAAVADLDDKYSFVVNRAELRKEVRMKWY